MRVLSIRQINLEFSDLYSRRPIVIPSTPHPRAPGVHQSDILRWIAVEKTGKLKRGERLEEDYPWRMAMGNMWEEFAFSIAPLKESEWQPGEATKDGISINPDGVGLVPVVYRRDGTVAYLSDSPYASTEPCVDETKCTECKALTNAQELLEKFSDNWWIYQHQGRGYCYVYGPRIVRWVMLHYRGDWRGSGPVCMEYVVEFTDGECRQTWEMQLRWKGEVERELGLSK